MQDSIPSVETIERVTGSPVAKFDVNVPINNGSLPEYEVTATSISIGSPTIKSTD